MYPQATTDSAWEELQEARREERKEEEAPDDATHACRMCGQRAHIETPQIKTENWCRGTCDGWSIFIRLDKYNGTTS